MPQTQYCVLIVESKSGNVTQYLHEFEWILWYEKLQLFKRVNLVDLEEKNAGRWTVQNLYLQNKAPIKPRTNPKKFGKMGIWDFEISFAFYQENAFEIGGQFTLARMMRSSGKATDCSSGLRKSSNAQRSCSGNLFRQIYELQSSSHYRVTRQRLCLDLKTIAHRWQVVVSNRNVTFVQIICSSPR